MPAEKPIAPPPKKATAEPIVELPCEVQIKEEPMDVLQKEETDEGNDKRSTSILEQVLTGNLTINDRKEARPKFQLSSKWRCAPCNRYYRWVDLSRVESTSGFSLCFCLVF